MLLLADTNLEALELLKITARFAAQKWLKSWAV